RQSLHAPVVEIAAAVEHDVFQPLRQRTLGDQLADCLRRVDVAAGLEVLAHRLFERRRRDQRLALHVVYDLRIDVLRRAENRQPLAATGRSLDVTPHARGASFRAVFELRHRLLRYFFLPSLRKMYSPAYFTPLPL